MKKYSKILIFILLMGSYCQVNSSSMKEVIEMQGSQPSIADDNYYSNYWINFTFRERSMWKRLTKKMNTLWANFKRRNIPKPKLIEHKDIAIDNKKCEIFQYNLSYDNEEVKRLRQALSLNGAYSSMGSNPDMCSKFPEYTSLSVVNASLFRLLDSIASLEDNGNKLSDNPSLEDAYTQLIWEVEDALPKELDADNYNLKDAVRKILLIFEEFGYSLERNILRTEEDIKKLVLANSNKRLINYLSIWERYTARFQGSTLLPIAIDVLQNVFLSVFLAED